MKTTQNPLVLADDALLALGFPQGSLDCGERSPYDHFQAVAAQVQPRSPMLALGLRRMAESYEATLGTGLRTELQAFAVRALLLA